MSDIWIQLTIIVLLTLLNGFFAASEIAVVTARKGRLEQQAGAGSRGARAALALAEEPSRFLATVQVGITLVSTFAAAFGGDVLSVPVARVVAPLTGTANAKLVALMLVVLGLTYLSLIVGELAPKRLALQSAEAVATFAAPIMQTIARLAAPIVWFLTTSSHIVLRLLGRAAVEEAAITEEDVLSLVREGTEAGAFETAQQALIKNVFDFIDAAVHTIMTPRTGVVALPVDTPVDAVVERVLSSGYSRIPVYQGSLDAIAGILHAKDLLRAVHGGAGEPAASPELHTLIRPAAFVPGQQRIGVLLQRFRQTRTHMAIVVDEYGQTDGVVTLEDVLEELTGDIGDEYDEAETPIVVRPDGTFLIDGRLAYADAAEQIGLPARAELGDLGSFDTVAGFMLVLLEHIPTAGETLSCRGWHFEIVDMDGVRIDKVLARPPVNAQSQGEAALAVGAALASQPDARESGTRTDYDVDRSKPDGEREEGSQ